MVLPVAEALAEEFRAAGHRRVQLSLNGVSSRRALQRHADGGGFIFLGRDYLAECGLRLGDTARVELSPDPSPDAVDLPAELEIALAQDAAAAASWARLTPGAQRGFIHRIATAKREETRARRAWEVIDRLKRGESRPSPTKRRK